MHLVSLQGHGIKTGNGHSHTKGTALHLITAAFTISRFKSYTNSVFLHDRKRPADTFRVYELHSLFVLKLP